MRANELLLVLKLEYRQSDGGCNNAWILILRVTRKCVDRSQDQSKFGPELQKKKKIS